MLAMMMIVADAHAERAAIILLGLQLKADTASMHDIKQECP